MTTPLKSNILLAYPNMTDSATLSGGTWQIPLNRLQDRRLTRVARTANCTPASTMFVADLGKPTKLTMVDIVRHNMTTLGKWRVTLSNAADFSTVEFSSDWIKAWPVLFSPDSLEWEDDNWWEGTVSEADRAGYPGLLFVQLPRIFLCRYVRIEFNDPLNPAGYLEFGRLFLASSWQPALNMDYGNSLAWEFTSTKSTAALGGTQYFDRRAGKRVLRFTLSNLTPEEALSKIFEMQRVLGADGEVLVMANPTDLLNVLRQSFIGRLRQVSPLTMASFRRFGTPFEIEELL
ncbi:hypothetical protein ACO0LO_01755 [Undibacterium sp. TJN25]|uniref:hypothetical protein n=1 Tax=Undibacterium sp. TJN25 TaxID=3413056 RepID=UPI003BEFF493